jgi:MFS family permease
MTSNEIGSFMGVLIFGGLSFQLPVGKIADLTNRRKVLAATAFVGAGISLLMTLITFSSLPLLFFFIWCFGGSVFTIYPLSMAYSCEKAQDADILPITGGFVFSYGIGAILGPILAPYAISLLGISGLFYFIGAIALILCTTTLIHLAMRPE